MTGPSAAAAAGASGTTAVISIVLAPVLGEYILILGMGLLGTLVALTEANTKTFAKSAIFVFRGLAFSFVFTSILTSVVLSLVPAGLGITPYAILSAVSFSIGWTSNRWAAIKQAIIEGLAQRVAKIIGKDSEGDGK